MPRLSRIAEIVVKGWKRCDPLDSASTLQADLFSQEEMFGLQTWSRLPQLALSQRTEVG